MSANLSNVITITLLREGLLAARDNLNIVAIMTSETGFLSTAKRFALYSDIQSVADDFGTSSKTFDFATTFFSASPNPINAGGLLVIGFYRASDETVLATPGVLTSAELNETNVIAQLQQISDGAFSVTVDGGAEQNIIGLDFQDVLTLDDVVVKLNAVIAGVTVTVDINKLVITSDTTGGASTLTFFSDLGVGTFLGDILGLATGTGATLVTGVALVVLPAESKVEAITAVKAEINIFGAVFIDQTSSVEAKALANFTAANNMLMYDVFSDKNVNFVLNPLTNVVWDIKLSGLKRYRCLFDSTNNRKMAVGFMARAHVVNFNAENSAITMNLKELIGITALEYTQTEITQAKNVGLDLYLTFKNVPALLVSGANGQWDEEYNLLGYVDAVQTDAFNLLKGTPTKIAQTTAGIDTIVDQIEKTTEGFVRAGVFAPGTWTSPDRFGDKETFDRSIEENGWYFLAGRLSDQPQVDRQDRKSPVIQGAVKLAGAVHTVDIIINVNI